MSDTKLKTDEVDTSTIWTVQDMRMAIAEIHVLRSENAAMLEAIGEAEQLLLAVDDGAQQDINGSNWYDARQKFISKLQPFLKP